MDLGFTKFGAFDAGDSGAPLHPLDWSGLCARLAAERDLRRALGDAPAVNPEPLANGKATRANAGEAGDNRLADLGGYE